VTNQDTAPGMPLELPWGNTSRGAIQVGKPAEDAPVNGERLMKRVLEKGHLIRAWRQGQRQGGSPGLDGMTVEEWPTYRKEPWPAIYEALLSGTYEPQPVKRVEIPTPDGGIRRLGVPTVLDRGLQQALVQVVQAAGDPHSPRHAMGSDRHGQPSRPCYGPNETCIKGRSGSSTGTWKSASTGCITTN
jgi:hypothetical protein